MEETISEASSEDSIYLSAFEDSNNEIDYLSNTVFEVPSVENGLEGSEEAIFGLL